MRAAVVVLNDETAKLLYAAVQANPREADVELRLTDRLIECGVKPVTAKKFAHEWRLNWLPMMEWEASERKKFLRGTSVEAIQAALGAANGRRRERTLELNDVLKAVKRARKSVDGWNAVGGGTVANAYGYASSQTAAVVAVGSNGKVRVAVGVVSASKGASLTNGLVGLTARGTKEQFRAWADAGE